MRKILLLTVGLLLLGAGIALAANTANQTVNFEVKAVNELAVSSGTLSKTLTIQTATAGSEPDSDSDNSTTYSFTTNQDSRKITGAIDSNMPSGLTLSLTLGGPGASGWSSAGKTGLSTTAATLATGGKGKASAQTITYTLDATTAADVQTGSRTVTLTLTSA